MATVQLLELTRQYCPEAVFIFTSTNKVYGDAPNRLPLVELETRFEIDPACTEYRNGIHEGMSIDNCLHSVFGASKVSADVMVQEYGKYFGMNTVCFRGGCLTGPAHAGTQLHGFLSYLVRCALTRTPYKIIGYGGKQVRDNIHSYDLVNMFWNFYQNPRCGEVYNAGGGTHSNCSVKEAVAKVESLLNLQMNIEYISQPRKGDHIWYVSDVSKFKSHYPEWEYAYSLDDILMALCHQQHQQTRSRLHNPTPKAVQPDSAIIPQT
jgi:CDP-paratose 2-epimerase